MTPIIVKKMKGIIPSTIGLIGAKKPYPILLHTRFGIHTFFVNFPIDVVILDDYNKVVLLKKNLKKNRVFFWNPKYSRVLELPAGIIQQNNIEKGTKITITYTK